MTKRSRNWYEELNIRLDYSIHSANCMDIHATCDKIVWAWQHHKITDAEKDELCNKAIEYLQLYM